MIYNKEYTTFAYTGVYISYDRFTNAHSAPPLNVTCKTC